MSYRTGKLTTAPALVEGAIESTNAKRNDAIAALQVKMESTSNWLDDAINSTKRKITEGADTGSSIQDIKKAKTTSFATGTSFRQKETNLSPDRSGGDKENSPNHVRVKPPPSAVKRKVNGMRVVDLRKELKQKGQETKGLKKDLQQRLLQAYTTVEKIMSPQKSDQSASEEKEGPPTEQAEDNIPDSESVEVIVFESSKKEESKSDEKEADIDRPIDRVPEEAPEDTDVEMMQSSEKKQKESILQSAPKLKESVTDSTEAMEVESSTEQSSEKTDASVHQSGKESETEEKRLSLMDCSTSEDNPSGTKAALAKDLKATVSTASTMSIKSSIESKGGSSSSRHGIAASRKVSQESLSSTSEDSSLRKSSEVVQVSKPAQSVAKESSVSIMSQESQGNKISKQEETTSTSPIKRVQAAIQLFTSKSPQKPKSTTTPSKLVWLNKAKFQKLKMTSSTEEDEKEVAAAKTSANTEEKKSDISEPMTTGKAMRRPGMGLYNNKATSSALKASSKYMTGQPNSTLSASAQATNEARKARLAEIRGKSKPVSKPSAFAAKATPASKDVASAISSLKSVASTSSMDSKNSKRKLLTAQMREKAAARKQLEAAADSAHAKPTASTTKDDSIQQPANVATMVSTAPSVPNSTASVGKLTELTKSEAEQEEKTTAMPMPSKKTEETPAKNVLEPELAPAPKQLLSPLDTYEISDREDSESESESDSESENDRKSRKKIPDWAQRSKLLPALEKQFAQGSSRCDPDEIFPEVQTCDLQAIFTSKRSKYVRRTSSANWSRDKVTPCEQLAYKRAMGFPKKK